MAVVTKDELTDRVRKEKEEFFSTPPRVDIDGIRCLLEAYKETEGQPACIRRANYFYKLCTQKGLFVDNNPIVGTATKYKYGVSPFIEIGGMWMRRTDRIRAGHGEAIITEEAREWINKALDYWKDINVYARTKKIMLEAFNVDVGVLQKSGVGAELTPSGLIILIADVPMLLNRGLEYVTAEIEEQKAKVDCGDPEGFAKWHWYKAASLGCEGMMKLAHRYASLAKEMADKETNPGRKQELERIAETCERVPAKPARSFYEALQCVWFLSLGAWLENPVAASISLYRFGEYMYPFYKKDKEEGKLTDEEAIELLHFFFLKHTALSVPLAPHGFAQSQSRLDVQITLGGLTPTGEDATTKMDWLVLEAQRRIRLPEPTLALIYHDKLSEEFLHKCIDVVRTGIGQPSFHNATVGVARILNYERAPVEEARTLSIVGCVQGVVPGCTDLFWDGFLSIAKMVELALNNGKDPLTGVQLGPQTGEAESFGTYEEFYESVVKQIKHFVRIIRNCSRVAWNIERDFPRPFLSALTRDCIKKGKDGIDGGARYTNGNGTMFIGAIDAANSLAAIKRLVFQEKKVSMKQLKEALAASFEGHEEILRMCLDAPKFGNDDEAVDSIAKEIYDTCWEEHQKHLDFLNRLSKPHPFSVTGHFAAGRFTGALPNGRRARLPLTDATVSAQPGTDRNGPTALVKSAAKAIDTIKFGCNHFNMRFHPVVLKDREGARNVLSLIKTYFDLGGWQIQFNCVSGETLKDAQLHPENYKDLVVRVAGFSAFYIQLDKEVQDEVIKRTELVF